MFLASSIMLSSCILWVMVKVGLFVKKTNPTRRRPGAGVIPVVVIRPHARKYGNRRRVSTVTSTMLPSCCMVKACSGACSSASRTKFRLYAEVPRGMVGSSNRNRALRSYDSLVFLSNTYTPYRVPRCFIYKGYYPYGCYCRYPLLSNRCKEDDVAIVFSFLADNSLSTLTFIYSVSYYS